MTITTLPYGIGTTAANIQSLESLGLPLPRADVPDYATYVENGAGTRVGQGWIVIRWRFTVLTAAQVAILRGYIGAGYIRSLKDDNTYGVYSATLVDPGRRVPKAGQVWDSVWEFRRAVAV